MLQDEIKLETTLLLVQVNRYVYVCVSMCMYVYAFVSMSMHVYACVSMCMYVYVICNTQLSPKQSWLYLR